MAEQLLKLRIELAKDRLVDMANKLGRDHPRVLQFSRKLDKLIVLRQRMVMPR